MTLKDACLVLIKNRISSAPIVDGKTGGMIGILDFKDLVAHVLQVIPRVAVVFADYSKLYVHRC